MGYQTGIKLIRDLHTCILKTCIKNLGVSSLSEREYVAVVIAHELAHQWFGDLGKLNNFLLGILISPWGSEWEILSFKENY